MRSALVVAASEGVSAPGGTAAGAVAGCGAATGWKSDDPDWPADAATAVTGAAVSGKRDGGGGACRLPDDSRGAATGFRPRPVDGARSGAASLGLPEPTIACCCAVLVPELSAGAVLASNVAS